MFSSEVALVQGEVEVPERAEALGWAEAPERVAVQEWAEEPERAAVQERAAVLVAVPAGGWGSTDQWRIFAAILVEFPPDRT